MAMVVTPISSYAQQQTNSLLSERILQQTNFIANLNGKNMVPPVNTPATGVAQFHINPDGSVCYSVDVSHITGVLGAHVGFKNGTELAELTNPYASQGGYPYSTIGAYPTASVNGMLASGDIKTGISGASLLSAAGLVGPLIGKNVTDLDNIIKSKDGYVTVRTVDHQRGEIQGQIVPTRIFLIPCLTTLRFAPPTSIPSPNSTRY